MRNNYYKRSAQAPENLLWEFTLIVLLGVIVYTLTVAVMLL